MNTCKRALPLSRQKFQKMSITAQHRHAANTLKKAYLNLFFLPSYLEIASWLNYPDLKNPSIEELSDRFHEHLKLGHLHLKEDQLLPNLRHLDTLSLEPYLPVDIYLDRLRSSHNIGAIIRTVEAFRLGEIHFSEKTPYIDHLKVQKSAMGCDLLVPCHQNNTLSSLKRPFIALETTDDAIPLYDYSFPPSFTLFLGNEELGLSKEILKEADVVLEIPLLGSKNSLNVASALAIAAFEVRRSLRKPSH